MAGDADAQRLFERFWQWRQREYPEFASYCGNHDYEDRWDDISEDGYLRKEKAVREFLSETEATDPASCSKSIRDSLTLLRHDLKIYLTGAKFNSYVLALNYAEGIQNEIHHQLTYHCFDTRDGFEKYIKRLKALPKRFSQIIPLMKQGIQDGLVLHKCSLRGVPQQLESVVPEKPEESFLMEPLMRSDTCLSNDEQERLKKEALEILINDLKPSLNELKEFVEKVYMDNTRKAEGVNTLKNGSEYYQKCLNFHLTCEMSPQEVYDIGLKEVARIRKLMLDIAKEEGFGEDLKAFQEKLRTSAEFKFQTANELKTFVEDICFNKVRPKLPKLFHTLPDVPLIVRLTPPSQPNFPNGFYSSGTADKSRPGAYLINGTRLEACKKYEFMALSLHEGEPGHHLQHSLSFTDAVPLFRQYIEDAKYYLAPRRFSMHTAYIEILDILRFTWSVERWKMIKEHLNIQGWGLYSEALGMELGLYTDNYSLFGRYSYEMWRAARLVVDPGLHVFGWTHAEAVKYLVDNTLRDEWSMINEVNRYITNPGQSCAYKIGELKLWELRHKAEKELGDLFDVRDYHDAVVKCGPCPITFLELAIEQYIAAKKG